MVIVTMSWLAYCHCRFRLLDVSKRTMTATANPNQLLAETTDPNLRLFLTRGEKS